MSELTLFEKYVLVNDLGGRLEAIAQYLHDNTKEIDIDEFFKTLYFPTRDVCSQLEATLDFKFTY